MIQEFSIENYLSFGSKQTISFVATSDKSLAEELIVEPKPGVRLLRLALLYGANASGKSNLLNAIQSLWVLLFFPQEQEHMRVREYEPFALRKGEPTRYAVAFWANGRKYEYWLENDAYSILYERMTYTSDKGVQSELYERKKGSPISFGSTLRMKAKQKDDLNKETLGNHTVLSTLNKKNIDVPPVMREVYEWIKSHVHVLGEYDDYIEIAEQSEENLKLKQMIVELLRRADFNISEFSLVTVTPPDDIADEIKNDKNLSEKVKERFLRPTKQILFTHNTTETRFAIEFGLESAGTQAYFRLARLLFDLKDCGCLVMKDELEESLHYDLLLHFLQTYIETGSRSQLLFTTHNQLLLDEEWLIRRDMVWFAEKERATGHTQLYRASDMGIHKNVSLMNAYRIGKLGAKPLLGSTLIATDEL